jgi:hypothetical protein
VIRSHAFSMGSGDMILISQASAEASDTGNPMAGRIRRSSPLGPRLPLMTEYMGKTPIKHRLQDDKTCPCPT